MLTICPPTPDDVRKAIDQSFTDLNSISQYFYSFDSLTQEHQELIVSLANFLAFNLTITISEKIQGEVDLLISSLHKALLLPEMKEMDISEINPGIMNLSQLKGGGLVPGMRIPSSSVDSYIYEGAPVLIRFSDVRAGFRVVSWEPDYSKIQCSNNILHGMFPLSSLIFFEPKTPRKSQEQEAAS